MRSCRSISFRKPGSFPVWAQETERGGKEDQKNPIAHPIRQALCPKASPDSFCPPIGDPRAGTKWQPWIGISGNHASEYAPPGQCQSSRTLQHTTSTVVFGEHDWSPSVHEQCIGRVFPDGQESPVMAYFLLADEGSDLIVADVLGIKKGQIDGVRNPDVDPLRTCRSVQTGSSSWRRSI